MKRIVFLICLISLLPIWASAQGSEIWLPLIVQNDSCGVPIMSDWKVIAPETTVNKVLNPSAEAVGNFTAVGGGTMTRATTYQKYGLYSYRIQTAADNQGGSLTLSALTNAIHYVTMRVRGTLPASWDWALDNSTYAAPTLLEAIDANWSLYGLQFPAAQANGSTALYIRQNGAGSGDFYIDGVQVEQKEYWTTYCDGERQGCSWNGTEHTSTSSRSAMSRAGGRIRDLQSDYSFNIDGVIGMGAPPQTVTVDEYALLPGGELNAVKVHPRPFTLTGTLCGASYSELDNIRQALIGVLTPDAYPKDEFGWQPVRLIYTGAASKRQISAHYESGLEGNIQRETWFEKVAVRFISTDNPFWEDAEGAESAAVLDTNDSISFRIVGARLKNTGQWSNLGISSGSGGIFSFAESDDWVYAGGDFLDFNGIAAADYIVRYNKSTQLWSALGSGMNGIVRALALGADGILYAGGEFTTAGGVAANYIAKWDGSSWSPLGSGMNNIIYALTIGPDGILYAGGAFTTAGGVAANYIAKWDGSSWTALGSGTDHLVRALAMRTAGILYAGGQFTTAGGISANRVAKWNGSSWTALGAGVNAVVYTLALEQSGMLYAGGEFTTAGGGSANRVACWNGTSWTGLGSGMNDLVRRLSIGPDGILYAGGRFTVAGGISLAEGIARWNGASWAHLDANLPGAVAPDYTAILASQYVDSVVTNSYDIFVGINTVGTGYCAGKVTAANNGMESAYPVIVIGRSGGTLATIETVRNETTGKELLFNYNLLDGETLTIDLDPMQKSIISNFFGPRPDAILANSDFGEWTLQPGDNNITCFVNVSGAPTIMAYMTWQNQYR